MPKVRVGLDLDIDIIPDAVHLNNHSRVYINREFGDPNAIQEQQLSSIQSKKSSKDLTSIKKNLSKNQANFEQERKIKRQHPVDQTEQSKKPKLNRIRKQTKEVTELFNIFANYAKLNSATEIFNLLLEVPLNDNDKTIDDDLETSDFLKEFSADEKDASKKDNFKKEIFKRLQKTYKEIAKFIKEKDIERCGKKESQTFKNFVRYMRYLSRKQKPFNDYKQILCVLTIIANSLTCFIFFELYNGSSIIAKHVAHPSYNYLTNPRRTNRFLIKYDTESCTFIAKQVDNISTLFKVLKSHFYNTETDFIQDFLKRIKTRYTDGIIDLDYKTEAQEKEETEKKNESSEEIDQNTDMKRIKIGNETTNYINIKDYLEILDLYLKTDVQELFLKYECRNDILDHAVEFLCDIKSLKVVIFSNDIENGKVYGNRASLKFVEIDKQDDIAYFLRRYHFMSYGKSNILDSLSKVLKKTKQELLVDLRKRVSESKDWIKIVSFDWRLSENTEQGVYDKLIEILPNYEIINSKLNAYLLEQFSHIYQVDIEVRQAETGNYLFDTKHILPYYKRIDKILGFNKYVLKRDTNGVYDC